MSDIKTTQNTMNIQDRKKWIIQKISEADDCDFIAGGEVPPYIYGLIIRKYSETSPYCMCISISHKIPVEKSQSDCQAGDCPKHCEEMSYWYKTQPSE